MKQHGIYYFIGCVNDETNTSWSLPWLWAENETQAMAMGRHYMTEQEKRDLDSGVVRSAILDTSPYVAPAAMRPPIAMIPKMLSKKASEFLNDAINKASNRSKPEHRSPPMKPAPPPPEIPDAE